MSLRKLALGHYTNLFYVSPTAPGSDFTMGCAFSHIATSQTSGKPDRS
jgi:hypothetical protein